MKPWAKAAVQGAACGLVFGAVVLIGGHLWQPRLAAAQAKQPAVAEVVRARRFEIVDDAGRIGTVLGMLPDGRLGMTLYDAAEKPRAFLGVFREGTATLDFYSAAGKERAVLGFNKEGNPSMMLADKAGSPRTVLGATRLKSIKTEEVTLRPESSLVLFDKDGKVMWEAP